MTFECISLSLSHISFSGLPSPPPPDATVEKTDQQQAHIWIPNLWDTRKTIANFLCRKFYFPLYNPLSGSKKEQMEMETNFCGTFLDKGKRVHRLHFPFQGEIRERFTLHNVKYRITVKGIQLEITCPLLKSNHSTSEDPFKVVFFGGNHTTGLNTLWYYPWAAGLCNIFKGKELPSAEFLLVSAYEVRTTDGKEYKFNDLATIALFTAELLKQIGKSNICIAYSIGTMLLLLASQHIDLETLTSHVCLDRGFSSVKAMSKNFIHGPLSFALASSSGLAADLVPLVQKLVDKVAITVLCAIKDQILVKANYLLDERIKTLASANKIKIAGFDLSLTIVGSLSTLHAYPLHLVTDLYLEEKYTNFKLENEDDDLAKQIIFDALPTKPNEKKEKDAS